MKRPTLFLSLLALCLVSAATQARDPCRFAGPRPSVPDPAQGKQALSGPVEGTWRTTPADARKDALDSARSRVIPSLRRQAPPVEWTPPADYVRNALVKDEKTEKK